MMEIKLATKNKCTGCAACHDACPNSCIVMQNNGLHKYPVIEGSKCVECGRCMTACPIVSDKRPENNGEQSYYAAWCLDDKVRLSATSGGVGTALAQYAIQLGWLVCGSAFDETWHLAHMTASDEKQLDAFKGSKYLQSQTEGVYSKVKELLSKGENVLFIGTPCQVAGLKNFIPEKFLSKIVTCSIICHGVNTPIVWKDFVQYLEQKNHAKLIQYNFRSKTHGWGQDKRGNAKLNITYSLDNGKVINEPAWKNLFHYWFGQHFMMRESCFHCPFRVENRLSDITIGDFWGLPKVLPNLKDADKGVSVLITSTDKGFSFIRDCNKIKLIPVDRDKTVPVLKGFIDNRNEQKKQLEILRKKQFENEYESKGFDYMIKCYPNPTWWVRIKDSIKHHLKLT